MLKPKITVNLLSGWVLLLACMSGVSAQATPTPAPTITSLSPNSVVAGTSAFSLTVAGTNFIGNSTVYFGDKALATTFVSATVLTATVTAQAIAKAGQAGVIVSNGSDSDSHSAMFTITAANPAPTLTGISPRKAVAGSSGFSMMVIGTNFTSQSVVTFGGTALATTYVSSTQVNATVPTSALAAVGSVNVVVGNGTGNSSSPVTFTITAAATSPTATSMSPNSAVAGHGGFTMSITGTNFTSSSMVYFADTSLVTRFVSATQLTATVTAALVANAGQAGVIVTNGPGAYSSTLPFTITAANPAPTLTGISPRKAVVGSSGFSMMVIGTNFTSQSVVTFGSMALATTYVSSTQVNAAVPTSALAAVSSVNVVVGNGTGNSSSPVTFTITAAAPSPTATSMSPNSAVAGHGGFTMTITGTNFTSSSMVYFADTSLVTRFVSSTQLTATVTTALVANAGQAGVIVTNGPGAYSSTLPFTITAANPAPTLTGISPRKAVAGSSGFSMMVIGTNFTSQSVVTFGGTALATTYVSSTQVNAAVPTSALAAVGSVNVVVGNGTGNSSSPVTFTITAAAPGITSVSPATMVSGSGAFALTVNGTNFTTATKVYFGQWALATIFVSANQITATVPGSAVAHSGDVNVAIATGDGTTSTQVVVFTVTAPAAQVVYLPSRTGVAGTDAVHANILLTPSIVLDLTAPVSATLLNPSTTNGSYNDVPAALVCQTGNVALDEATTFNGNGAMSAAYRYQTATLAITVMRQTNNEYEVDVMASGLDLSVIDPARPVTVGVDIGGQTFSAQVQPSVYSQ